MRPEERELLASEYARLIAQASRAGLLAPSGLTPREQSECLLRSECLPGADLERLCTLVERCLYARGGTPGDRDEAVALCRQLSTRLPLTPPAEADTEPTADRPRRRERHLLGKALDVLPRLAPFVLVGLALYGLQFADVSCSGGGSSSPGRAASSAGFRGELAAVKTSQGSWVPAPTRRTVIRPRIPAVLTMARTRPSFDTSTGLDVDFANQPDPFRPKLSWTHRREVFPTVDADFHFVAAEGAVFDAEGEGDEATASFRANVQVILRRDVAVPVPSPAPDAVVIHWTCSPDADVQFVKDEADVLYVVADTSLLVRLEYTLATFSDYHFAPFPAVPFEPKPVVLPDNVQAAAEQVLGAIGGLPAETFAETVRRLHAYFSGFSVCPVDPGELRENHFLTVALSRKGVCRHRARAFCITAQALGLNARLAENRAHSFAEVELPDGTWRRLEFRLGRGERPPVPHTAAAKAAGAWSDETDYKTLVSVFAAVLGSLALIVAITHRQRVIESAHVTPQDKFNSRVWRRAARDHDQALQARALTRLLTIVRFRVAARLGAGGEDAESLREAADRADLPDHVRPRLADVLRLEPDATAKQSASDLQYAYWNSYHVLQWISGGKPW